MIATREWESSSSFDAVEMSKYIGFLHWSDLRKRESLERDMSDWWGGKVCRQRIGSYFLEYGT